MLDLSIIIVNWNSRDYLADCLKSLKKNPPNCLFEILVIDGASFDGSDRLITEDYPDVIFIQSNENIGFGRCNNLAAESAKGEFLLLLNPDTIVKRRSIDELLSACKSIKNFGIAGARLLNSDGSLQKSSVQALPTPMNQALDSEVLYKLFPKAKLWNHYHAYSSLSPIEVEAVSGACMLIPKEIFNSLGGFSKHFFMYAEDMDLCFRIRKLGYSVLHVPASLIVHHGGGSSSTESSEYSTVMMRRALYTYMEINHSTLTAFGYRLCLFVSALIRLPILIIINLIKSSEIGKSTRVSILKWTRILKWSIYDVPKR